MGKSAAQPLHASKSYTLHGQQVYVPQAAPGLHVVATPIGNLDDITIRALRILAGADRIACEDTRVTAKLLQRYGIKNPLLSYHEHNTREAGPKLLHCLEKGEAIALVSDAGTPLISDPGADLVARAHESQVYVNAVPGASALLAALSSAALPADEFHFFGFLPPKQTARRKALELLKEQRGTLIFYETAPRLAASLSDMLAVLGSREAAMCRELTKLHEQIVKAPLDELVKRYESENVKGEIVILLAAAKKTDDLPDPLPLLKKAMITLSLKEAVAQVTKATGLPRRSVYEQALKLKDGA